MNVLSLFDGMSCGQIALERAGINYDTYYASEIDKYAIQVAKNNYPNTLHIGSVTDKGIRGSGRPSVSTEEGFLDDNRCAHRMLTPNECEALQTVPKNYTDCVSKTQRYKMLGNGWTVDVIAHIFKNIK